MKTKTRKPAHPGRILKRQYLQPLGSSIAELARALAVSRNTVSRLVNERGGLSADMALRLSEAFNTSPELWLSLQRNYDLWCASHESKDWKKIRRIAV